MSYDEGPSRPFLSPEDYRTKLDEDGPDSQQALTGVVVHDASYPCVAVKSLVKTPKARPLDLADAFKRVEGVPAFTWKDPVSRTPFRVLALSFDKTRMAVLVREKIRLYNIVDNYTLVAETKECLERVNCVAFPWSKNDVVLVVHENSEISLFSVRMDDNGNERFLERVCRQEMFVIDQTHMLPQYDTGGDVLFPISSHIEECWVLAWDPNKPNELNLLSATEREYCKAKIQTHAAVKPHMIFMSIPQKTLMVVFEKETDCRTIRTWICNQIDFKEGEVITITPVEVEGRGIGLSECGKYALLWSRQHRNKSEIRLYDTEALKADSPDPFSLMTLPIETLDVGAQLFDRNKIEFTHADWTSIGNVPVVAFLLVQQNKVSLSFWDPLRNTILKQLELTTRTMDWRANANLRFCISPNIKWIALGGWSDGRFGLFSLVSEWLVWDVHLHDEELARWPHVSIEFDVSCTKLVVNCSTKLYALAPPCLTEDYRVEMKCGEYELSVDDTVLFPPLTWEHRRLLPKQFLIEMMLSKSLSIKRDYKGFVDVALSKISTKTALLVWKKRPTLVVARTMDALSSADLKGDLLGNKRTLPREGVDVMDVTKLFEGRTFSDETPYANVFLYPDREREGDLIVIFGLRRQWLPAMLIEPITQQIELTRFAEDMCIDIGQTSDGHRVACVMKDRIMIIHLNRRETVYTIMQDFLWNHPPPYHVDLKEDDFEGHGGVWNVTLNSWNTYKREWCRVWPGYHDLVISVDPIPSEDHPPSNRRCGNYSRLSYSYAIDIFEYKERGPEVTGLEVKIHAKVAYEETRSRKWNISGWNAHTQRMLTSIDRDNVFTKVTMQHDDTTGHIWGVCAEARIIRTVFVPIGPFSFDESVPCPHMRDYPTNDITIAELENEIRKHGETVFTMIFNGKSNCDIVWENDDMNMGWKISDVAARNGIVLSPKWKEKFLQNRDDNRLELAIDGSDYAWVKTCLDTTIEKMSTDYCANMLTFCFEELWTKFQSLMIRAIVDSSLWIPICDVEVYESVLVGDEHLQVRVGTCESIEWWKELSDAGKSFSEWKKLNEQHALKIERHGTPTKAKATLKVCLMNDVYKAGLNGIIRLLLMTNAPSHIFKSPLVKWVIVFKWEKIWRHRSVTNFIVYLFYIGTFSAYTICIGFYGRSHDSDGATWKYLSTLLCASCLMALYMASKEAVQLSTFCNDAQALSGNHLYGFRSYFSSPWNIVELASYILLFVILCLHMLCLYDASLALPLLYVCSGIELLAMWIKIWYYAQPFKRTGALVLLVENVVRDSIPFLLLLLVVLVGFGLALYAIFQSVLHTSDFEEDNGTREDIERDFGNPIKSMLTLFYAMVGMFDPTIFLECGLWSILIIAIFVAYLGVQMILMLNMLIALMGDTFDRVKSTEEEQLLLGRARFIDACEAQLTAKQIEEIERKVHKFLYVIFPLDQDKSEETNMWQGRVKTIEDKVEKMINDLQGVVISKIERVKTDLQEEITELKVMMGHERQR